MPNPSEQFPPAPPRAPLAERPPAMWTGEVLWLDFVNTRYVDRDRPVDVLASFGALVDWLTEAGALPLEAAREAVERWEGTPEGDEVLREALGLRAALHG